MILEPISIIVFVTASAVAAYLLQRFQSVDSRTVDRLNELRRGLTRPTVQRSNAATSRQFLGNSTIGNSERQLLLRSRLTHAGVSSRSAVSTFLITKLSLTILPAVILASAFACSQCSLNTLLAGGMVGGIVGLLLPDIWLKQRIAARQAKLTRSIPDFLDLLLACLEAGLSLEAALQRVTSELQVAHRELAKEMQRVQQEIELGTTTDEALRNFSERSGLDSIRTLGSTIQHARRFGSNISDALRSNADTLRTQREYRAEELAQQAAVKILFPTLLCIFPTVFVILAGPAAIQLYEKFGCADTSVIAKEKGGS